MNVDETRAVAAQAYLEAERASIAYRAARKAAAQELVLAVERGLQLLPSEIGPWLEGRIPADIVAAYHDTQAADEAARLAHLEAQAADTSTQPNLRRKVDVLADDVEILMAMTFSGKVIGRNGHGQIITLTDEPRKRP